MILSCTSFKKIKKDPIFRRYHSHRIKNIQILFMAKTTEKKKHKIKNLTILMLFSESLKVINYLLIQNEENHK